MSVDAISARLAWVEHLRWREDHIGVWGESKGRDEDGSFVVEFPKPRGSEELDILGGTLRILPSSGRERDLPGTIISEESSHGRITICFKPRDAIGVLEGRIFLSLPNRGTKRQLERLRQAAEPTAGEPPHIGRLFGTVEEAPSDQSRGFELEALLGNQKELDEFQRKAVELVCGDAPLVCIQGPPGTGKTTVIAESCLQFLQQNPTGRVFIVSEQHIAVDNALERIPHNPYVRKLRLGRSGTGSDKYRQPNAPRQWLFDCSESCHKRLKDSEVDEGYKELLEAWRERTQSPCDRDLNLVRAQYENGFNVAGVTLGSIDWTKEDRFSRERGEWRFRNEDENLDTDEILERGSYSSVASPPRAEPPTKRPSLVIVDEAARSVPPLLAYGARRGDRLILIGDHKQIEPDTREYEECEKERRNTVGGERGGLDWLHRHAFKNLYKRVPSVMLRTQYRMHPAISGLVAEVYDKQLRNGMKPEGRARRIHWWITTEPCRSIYGGNSDNQKELNDQEIQRALIIAQWFSKHQGHLRVAVLCSYRAQAEATREKFNEKWPSGEALARDQSEGRPFVDTVHAAQGREFDVVVISTSRTDRLTDYFNQSMLNVAVTRAKEDVFVLGRPDLFARHGRDQSNDKKIYWRLALELGGGHIG